MIMMIILGVQNMRIQMPNAHLIISFASLYLHYFYYILFPSLELLRAFMLCKARDVEHTLTFSVCVCFFHASHLPSEKNGKFYNWDTVFVRDNCHQIILRIERMFLRFLSLFTYKYSEIIMYIFIQHFGLIVFEIFHMWHFPKWFLHNKSF